MRTAVRATLAALPLAAGLALAGPAHATSYATLDLTVDVNAPADAVWAVVGGYCDIKDWLGIDCEVTTGDGVAVGSVRTLYGGSVEELLTGVGQRSYSYQQTVGGLAVTNYHGSLSVTPIDDAHARIEYTLLWDEDALPAGQAASMFDNLNSTFQGALDTMKSIAEAN